MEPTEPNSISTTPPTQTVSDITPTEMATEQKTVTSVPTEQPIFQEIPPKSKSKIFPVLIILIVFVVLGSLGYFAYQKYFASSKQTLVEVTPTQVPAINPINDWKTYINTRQKYQFSHPKTWNISENTTVRAKDNQKQDIVTIDINGATPRLEIDSNNELNLSVNDIREKTKSAIKIDNLETFSDYQEDEGGGEFTTYYFIKNDKIFTITTTSYSDSNIQEYQNPEEIFRQILSTFKFLSLPSPTPTTNLKQVFFNIPTPSVVLKTYTNIEYNFSFKYPSNFYTNTDIGIIKISNSPYFEITETAMVFDVSVEDKSSNILLKNLLENVEPENIKVLNERLDFENFKLRLNTPITGTYMGDPPLGAYYIYIKLPNMQDKYIQIVIRTHQKEEPAYGGNYEDSNTAKQILSTFKFID